MPTARGIWAPLAALVSIALVAIGTLASLAPPEVAREDAPLGAFSAERAMQHVHALSKAPRAVGSPGHAAARRMLVDRLGELGLATEIQKTVASTARYGSPFDAAFVENVVALRKGSSSTGAVLLVAHYDSVPSSPGASDDAAGVAAILEVLRALGGGPPPANDVIALFTDAEEGAMAGAEAFAAEHPLAASVRFVVNLDARGTRGALLLFDTSGDERVAVEALARAGVRPPIASSLFPALARRIHRGTDFAPFARRGIPGMNFVFADGAVRYHTPADDAAHLDPRSLQHMGDVALALSRHVPSGAPRQPTMFFVVPGAGLVFLSGAWAVPIAAALASAFAGLAWTLVRSRRAELRGMLRGALLLAGAVALSGAATFAIGASMRRLHPVYRAIGAGDTFDAPLQRLAFALASATIFSAIATRLRHRVGPVDLALGAGLVLSPALVALAFAAPATTTALALPFAGLLVGMLSFLRRGARSFASALTGAAIVVVSGAPTVAVAFVGLELSRAYVAASLVALLFGLAAPWALVVASAWRWTLPGATGTFSAVLLALAAGTARFDAETPRPTCLGYALDTSSGRAWWLTDDPEPSAFSERFVSARRPEGAALPPFTPWSSPTRWAPSPPIALHAPSLTVLGDRRDGDARVLSLRIRSPRGAPWIWIALDAGARVVAARLEDKPVATSASEGWGLHVIGLPPEGAALELTIPSPSAPIAITLVDRSHELPSALGVPPKPPGMMAARSWLADATFVRRKFEL